MTPLARAKVALLRLAARELRTAKRGSVSSATIRDRATKSWHLVIAGKDEWIAWRALERAAGYLEMVRAVGDAEDVLVDVEWSGRANGWGAFCPVCDASNGDVWNPDPNAHHYPDCRLARLVGRDK